MMKKIRSTLMSMAAGLVAAAAGLLPGMARADGPIFTIVNQSGDTNETAHYYYLGYGQLKHKSKPNDFIVLQADGSWAKPGSTNWNKGAWNGTLTSGAGVVPCYRLKDGQKPKVSLPTNLTSARIFFFRVPKGSPWYSQTDANTCNASPVQGSAKQMNGIFGNILYKTLPKGSTKPNVAPFSFVRTTSDGGLSGASPAMIVQTSLPVYTYSESGGPDPADTYPVADIDASMVDLIGFPTNIIAQIDQRVLPPKSSKPSIPTGEGVGFSFSKNGEVNMASILSSYDSFVSKLGQEQADYNNLKVVSPGSGGTFLVNPGNYLSYISPNSTAFSKHFHNLIEKYIWNPGWQGTIDLGGAFTAAKFPATPFPSPFAGQAVKLDAKAFPNYKGYSAKPPQPLYAIKFTSTPSGIDSIQLKNRGKGYTSAPGVTLSPPQSPGGVQATATAAVSAGKITGFTITSTGFGYTSAPTVTITGGGGSGGAGTAVVNTKTFIAYVLSPLSYATLCNAKVISPCPATLSAAYQIFAGDGALGAPIITSRSHQWRMLNRLHPNEAKAWNKYGGAAVYSQIVARLSFILSSAFQRGVAGGLQTTGGLCDPSVYNGNVSYCWSDQKNWYPNGSSIDLSQYFDSDITQNQFSRWLHTSQVPGQEADSLIPIVTRPTNTVTTKSGDVMGMAYGFSDDENPTPQLPLAMPQQTPSEYSSNVLSEGSDFAKNCITIMPYNQYNNPAPPSTSCIPQ